MKIKFISILIIAVAAIVLAVHLLANINSKKVLIVEKIDDQGVYVGPEIPKLKENSIDPVLRDINYAWDSMHEGNSYFKVRRYKEAAEAYKKAYSVHTTSGGSGIAGMKLIDT